MRNEFGFNYGREELTTAKGLDIAEFDEPTGFLSPFLAIGIDSRTQFYHEMNSGKNSLFQMQGDLSLEMKLNKRLRLLLKKGFYSGAEIAAVGSILPFGGYVKVGKFTPDYGLRIDDHNAFIRGGPYSVSVLGDSFPNGYSKGLGLGERSEDTGLEIGFTPWDLTLTLGVFNGTPGNTIAFAPGSAKAIVSRLEYMMKFDEFNILVGGSSFSYPATSGAPSKFGMFGGIGIDKDLSILLEYDIVSAEVSNSIRRGSIFFVEASYMIVKGYDVRISYEFYDPDTKLKNGAFTQISAGVSFFPLPGVEIYPMVRLFREEPYEINNDQLLVQLHLFL